MKTFIQPNMEKTRSSFENHFNPGRREFKSVRAPRKCLNVVKRQGKKPSCVRRANLLKIRFQMIIRATTPMQFKLFGTIYRCRIDVNRLKMSPFPPYLYSSIPV